MTDDKFTPYVTTFDDIKPGQTIEREWTFRGIRHRAEGVAQHLSPNSEGQWLTVDGGIVAGRTDSTDTLRVVAEPAMPTAWGTTIRIKGGAFDGRLSVLADQSDLPWLTQGAHGYLWLGKERIPDWTVLFDPSPKSEDGMREQLEKLAESIKGAALLYRTVSAPEVYSSLQRILNETSAS